MDTEGEPHRLFLEHNPTGFLRQSEKPAPALHLIGQGAAGQLSKIAQYVKGGSSSATVGQWILSARSRENGVHL